MIIDASQIDKHIYFLILCKENFDSLPYTPVLFTCIFIAEF